MKYRHSFRVNAPVAQVAEFHRKSESLRAITPTLIGMQIQRAPRLLGEGDEFSFVMRVGPLPVAWHAQIEGVSTAGFTDRQLNGPFLHWVHRHSFTEVGPQETLVADEIEAGLRRHPFWGPFGLGMWIGLPFLFAYRGWKTRRLIAQAGRRQR